MPAETDPHERTLIVWPPDVEQCIFTPDQLGAARADYATIVRTIAGYEPVTLVVRPDDLRSAQDSVGDAADLVEIPVDDSWFRDDGPIVVRAPDGSRPALHFRFNAWGDKQPHDADALVGAEVARRLGLPVHEVGMVLEGGSIAVDGRGTLVTTERCLLNPNRNPDLDRAGIETVLRACLGVDRIVWLADAIAEDDGTDGHVDNVVAFTPDGTALVQGCDDDTNPNAAIAARQRAASARSRARCRRDAGPPLRRVRRPGAARPLREPLRRQRLRRGPGERPSVRSRLRSRSSASTIPGVTSSRFRASCSRTAVAACIASPSRYRRAKGCGMIVRTALDVLPSPARVRKPERTPVRVGLVQLAWNPDPVEHDAAITDGIRVAADIGARLVCLPELTRSRYFAVDPRDAANPGAEPEPLPGGPTHELAARCARETSVFVHASCYEAAADGRARLQHRVRRRARR